MLHALALAALLTAQAADTVSTVRLLHTPGHAEGNPLLPSSSGGIMAAKVSITSAVAGTAWHIRKQHPKTALLLCVVGAVSGSIGAAHNARVR
jgi:uncharacterized membrane protein YfcA